MALIALELSDAGIMATVGPAAQGIPVDGEELESPGYVLPLKKKLLVGRAAQGKSHLYPRQTEHRFWDQLSTSSLKQTGSWADNYAEMAHAHLSAVWQRIKSSGQEVVITLPGYFTRDQMGLLLGIAQDIGMQVKGLISQAVAACPHAFETPQLLYLDAHLHRTEVSLLEQSDRLRLLKTLSLDQGLVRLHRIWIEAIAREFVSATRYDPLHTAVSEQELYDRLPEVLSDLAHNLTTSVQTRADHAMHRISLSRQSLIDIAGDYYDRIGNLVDSLMEKRQGQSAAATLLLSHRLGSLPGLDARLNLDPQASTVVLPPGTGVKNVVSFWEQLERDTGDGGAYFFKERPWSRILSSELKAQAAIQEVEVKPTHLLYRNIAHPLVQKPLAVVRNDPEPGTLLKIVPQEEAEGGVICSVNLEGDHVVLSVGASQKIFVDGRPAEGRMELALGQVLSLKGTPDTIRLIACI